MKRAVSKRANLGAVLKRANLGVLFLTYDYIAIICASLSCGPISPIIEVPLYLCDSSACSNRSASLSCGPMSPNRDRDKYQALKVTAISTNHSKCP